MDTLDSLFSWFTVATLRSALLALAVLTIQAALRGRMPARWRYALWLPVIFVGIFPRLPQSRWSLENRFVPTVTYVQRPASPVASAVRHTAVHDRTFVEPSIDQTPAPATPFPWRRVSAEIWLGGAAGLLIFSVAAYVRTMRRMRQGAVQVETALVTMLAEASLAAGRRRPPHLLVSTAVKSPAVTGFLRPMLLLPADFPGTFTRKEARLVLLHELMHLRCLDLPVNWLLCLLQAIHWCNPVLWFAFARMRADREAACDAQVLALTSEDHRAAYGHALLKLEGGLAHTDLSLGFLGIFERTAGLRARIRAIAAYRRPHPAWGVLSVALIAAFMLAGATRAQNPGASSAPELSKRERIERKLQTIIIPRLELRDAGIQEALDFLEKKSVELDTAESVAANRGINIVLKPGAAPGSSVPAGSPAADPRAAVITLSLANIPLAEALRSVTKLAGLTFTVEPDMVQVVPVSVATDLLRTMEWRVTPQLGLKPGIDAKEFLIARGLTFPEGTSAQLSPDGTRLVVRNTEENLDFVFALLFAAPAATKNGPTVLNAGESLTENISRKLSTIIVPRLEFRAVTIREAIDFLKKKGVELDTTEPDPAKRGVNLVLRIETPVAPIAKNPNEARITISLSHIPLGEALRYACSQAGLKYKVEAYAVSIVPANVSTDLLITKECKLNEAIASALGLQAGIDAKEALNAKGIAFPPGSSAIWISKSQKLVARNTQENLDLLEHLTMKGSLPPPPTSRNPAPVSVTQRKAESIIIPKFDFRGATLRDVIDFLRTKSVALDPEGRGVNLVVQNFEAADADANRRITVALTNTSLWEAMRQVAGLVDMEVFAESHALRIQPKSSGERAGGTPATR